ncbi:MAG: hypothetical protein ACI9WU_004391, partial [Myxococcota bacterium]
MIARDTIAAALERRYDYYSARTVLSEARSAASLEDKAEYSAAEVKALIAGIKQVGDRVGAVLEALEALASTPTPEPEPK